jgi:transcriptional regulator with XRE-family HTH domain
MEKLAEKLKELRIEKGLSQREVSSALGMTRNAFTNYENGYREPSLDNLKKICQFFDVSADYLLGLKDF